MNWKKELKLIGFYFMVLLAAITLQVFIVSYLILLSPILIVMPKFAANVVIWMFLTWAMFMPIAGGLTIGIGFGIRKENKRQNYDAYSKG